MMPKLAKGSTIFGSGASPGILSCIAGRLLCDTYLCSRDLLKEVWYLSGKHFHVVLLVNSYMQLWVFQVSYSLTQLAKTQLNKNRKDITPHDIPRMFQSSESLTELVSFNSYCSFYFFCFYFSYLFCLSCMIINPNHYFILAKLLLEMGCSGLVTVFCKRRVWLHLLFLYILCSTNRLWQIILIWCLCACEIQLLAPMFSCPISLILQRDEVV